mmetsp:Transcript_15933/g.43715  ORF Transcript_15933/g.43715 Transcript_15933/m.43715 type:complete len:606 (-) Transcript_15933:31-1848(-)
MISSAWSLISSSAEVITGARRMTLRIHRLLQPGLLELNESDRRRLLGLQKRVECLVQPLNFLLLWSKKRDSCVQQVVLSAQELLFDVCGFVERFVPQDGSPTNVVGGKNAAPGGSGIDSDQLEYYLRELEFACASVSMAVNIARATEASPPFQPSVAQEPRYSVGGGGASVAAAPVGGGVSLSALLRASRRIQEMRGRSGDLCACPGRLYSQAVGHRSMALPLPLETGGGGSCSGGPGAASTAGTVGASSSGSGAGNVVNNAGTAEEASEARGADAKTDNPWQLVLSMATFKVVAAMETRHRWRRYSISVESRLPLSQRDSPRPPVPPAPDPASGGYPSGGSDAPQRGLNALGPLNVPIEAALEANLSTTAHVSLPSEPARCSQDLGIDSLVLVWGGCGGGGAASSTVSGGAATVGTSHSLDEAAASADFPDAVLLPAFAEGVPRPLRRVSRCLRNASPTMARPGASSPRSCGSGLGQTRYAFAFDGPRGVAEPRSGEAEVALTPLDALYLARLCALDDGQQQLFQQDASGAGEATATCPPHLLTSDEVLVALLQDTEGFSEPDIRGRTGESARDVVIEAGAAVVEVASTIAGERADSCTAEGDR